jgi:TonB family protein
VSATIDESGNVRAAAVAHGHPLFDRAALTAAQRWSFNAGPGSRHADLTFSFRVNKDSTLPRETSTTFVSPFRVEIVDVLPEPVVNYDERDSR